MRWQARVSDRNVPPHYYGGSRWFLALLGFGTIWLLLVLFNAQERSEKLAVELTIRSVRTGLKVAVAEAMLKGKEADIAHWAGTNPFDYLGGAPERFRGNCSQQPLESMPRGTWCFNAAAGELAYRPRHTGHLRLLDEAGESEVLRWRIAGVTYQQQHPPYFGLNLQLLTPYRWFDD